MSASPPLSAPGRLRSRLLHWFAFALLTGHAALALSGVVQVAGWLPIAESLVASVLGLRLLARSTDAADAGGAGVLPARVAAPAGEPIDTRRA